MGRLAIALIPLLFTACTWVEVSDAGRNVRVAKSAVEITGCTQVGTANAKVADKVVITRNAQKVAYELETIARNEAASLGGDTIMASSAVVEGKQSFAVYRCN